MTCLLGGGVSAGNIVQICLQPAHTCLPPAHACNPNLPPFFHACHPCPGMNTGRRCRHLDSMEEQVDSCLLPSACPNIPFFYGDIPKPTQHAKLYTDTSELPILTWSAMEGIALAGAAAGRQHLLPPMPAHPYSWEHVPHHCLPYIPTPGRWWAGRRSHLPCLYGFPMSENSAAAAMALLSKLWEEIGEVGELVLLEKKKLGVPYACLLPCQILGEEGVPATYLPHPTQIICLYSPSAWTLPAGLPCIHFWSGAGNSERVV